MNEKQFRSHYAKAVHGGNVSHNHFVMRRRLLVPRWWLEGLLNYFGLKRSPSECWLDAFFLSRLGTTTIGVPTPSIKIFELLCCFWNACFQKIAAAPIGDERSIYQINLSLRDLGFSSSIDLAEHLAAFQNALLMPIETLRISLARGRLRQADQAVLLEQAGAVSGFVRSMILESDGQLRLEFHEPLRKILSGEIFEVMRDSVRAIRRDVPGIVSVNPSVLRAQGRKGSIRRLALYLYLEVEKHAIQEFVEQSSPCLLSDHSLGVCRELLREFSREGKTLYDLGALGWFEKLPSRRISELRVRRGVGSSCVFLAAMPSLGRDVVRYESSFEKSNGSLVNILGSTAALQPKMQQSVKSPKKESPTYVDVIKTPALNQDPLRRVPWRKECLGQARRRHGRLMKLAEQQRLSESGMQYLETQSAPRVDSEKAEILKLAQYYESLSPSQRQELDREMRLLQTPSDFQKWLKPILDRLH